jgi:hypothetical protein
MYGSNNLVGPSVLMSFCFPLTSHIALPFCSAALRMYLGAAGSGTPAWPFAGRVEVFPYERPAEGVDEATRLKGEFLDRF